MSNVRINVLIQGMTARLRRQLNNPTPLMRQLGALMVAESGRAFDESRLGEYEWPKRYPNMGDGDNFVNIAGIVQDFADGKTPPLRRFQSRPPLLDTGWLRRTMKDTAKSMTILGRYDVEVGSNDPRANRHQWGGQDEQFVTDTVRDNLAGFLRGGPTWRRTRSRKITVNVDVSEWDKQNPRRKFKRTIKETYLPKVFEVKHDRGTGYMGTRTRRERFGDRLGFLFRSRVLITRVNQRPFVGIPDELRGKLLDTTVAYFQGTP